MSEEYVSKETHQANIETLAVAIDDTNRRIDDLKDDVSRNIAGLGIVIALVGVLLAGVQIAIAVLAFKP